MNLILAQSPSHSLSKSPTQAPAPKALASSPSTPLAEAPGLAQNGVVLNKVGFAAVLNLGSLLDLGSMFFWV